MNQPLRAHRPIAFGSSCHSALRSLLLMLAACLLLLPGLSHAQDVDNDGILDTIDPNPGLANPKLTRTGTVSGGYTMQILGSGRVASIRNTTGTAWFTSTANGADQADVAAVSQAILDQFKDEFDFIFLASNRTDVPTIPNPAIPPVPATIPVATGVHFPVTNHYVNPATGNVVTTGVTGIGAVSTIGAATFGSGGRLQSLIHLATRNGLQFGPGLHELMHRWANNINTPFPGILDDPATPKNEADPGHWGFSSIGGQLGGYKPGSRELVSGTTYRARSPRTGDFGGWALNVNGGNIVPFSQLELYLMGMIPKEQVTDPMEVANGLVLESSWNSEAGTFNVTAVPPFSTVTMANITSTYGDRNPLAAASQKNFRAMLVVLTDSDLTNSQWAIADATVQGFAQAGDNGTADYTFWEATGGRGTMQMNDLCQSLKTVAADTVSVTQASVSFPAAGGTQNVNITATGSWVIGSLPAWLTAVPSSGSGNATVTLTATANNGLNRASHLGVANVCGSVCVAVTQPSSVANSAFSISPATRMVDAFPPGSYTFTVTSNVAWSIGTPLPSSALPSWITSISPTSGTGNATVTVNYSNMTAFNDPIRQAEIKIGERILPDLFVPFATHTVTQVPGQPNVARDTALDTSGLFYTTFAGSGGSIWSDVSPMAGAVNGNALGSGATPDNVFSLLRTYVSGPADLTFRWAVSSQAGADTLSLNINGQIERQISGEVGWTTVTRRLPAGANTIVWTYQKDTSGAAGSDRGWVDQVVVTPLNSATLTTAAPASVTANSAVLGGNVTALGTGTVTERGIVWGRYTSPTTGDNKVVIGSGSGTGIFSNTVTGLPANTSVWVRAYAMNSSGGSTFATAYGENQCFRTTGAAVPEIAVEQPAGTNLNSGATVAYGTQTVGVASAAKTFTIKNTGAGPLTVSSVGVTGGNAGDFTVNTTGMASSVPATTGSTTFTVTFNPSAAGARSTTLRIVNNDSDEGTFDLLLTGTGISLPTVTTADPASVAATSASLGGNVTSAGGGTVSDRGIVWNTTGIPTIASNKVANGSGTGSFTATVSSLPSGTLIYVRAYARNEAGLAYGQEKTFTTTIVAAPGTIVWSPTQNWTGAATQVLTNGARHAAVCFVPSTAANPVVNGLTFDRPAAASPPVTNTTPTMINFVNGSPISVSSWWYAATTAPVSGSGDFVTLVNQATFHQMNPATITIGSLVVGQEYQVQIFMPYWEPQWPTTFSSVSGATVTLNGGRASGSPAAQYATGTFTAAATSHVINFSAAAPGPWAGVSAISVRRTSLSTNADLFALATTAGTLPFAAATTSYTASVPNATTSVTVTPTVADANATVKVNTVTVSTGAASGPISLNVGANTITTVVTAEDGTTTKTYTLTVTRAAPALTGVAITPTSVITTSQWINPDAGVRGKMIDGSGLSGGGSVLTQTHDQLATAETMWHAGPDGGGLSGGTTGNPPTVAGQAVEFDLGANYNLTGAHIWNMNQQHVIERGVKDVQILVSSATTGAFTPLITTIFTQGTGNAGLAAQVVPLTGANNVRRVRFAIQSAWSGAAIEYVGLSEVRFQGTAAVGNLPPTITAIPNLTMLEDGWDTSTTFTVADPNPGSTLTVTQSSDNTALIRFDNTDYYTIAKDGDSYNFGIAPVENMTGTANVTITVSDGTLTATRVFVVTVTGVNDRPTFTYNTPAPISVAAGSGLQTRPGIATGISPGPTNESSQTVDFIVTSNNNPLFSVQPAIDAAGNLSFTPGNTAGTATVSFQARDSGGTANGGVDTSSPVRTFTIELTAAPGNNQVTLVGSNPGAIPDNSPTGRDILFNVTGTPGVVKTVSTGFTVAHPFMRDLRIQLIAPNGKSAWIFRRTTSTPTLNCDTLGPYIITDPAATTIEATATPLASNSTLPSGEYRAVDNGAAVSLNLTFGGTDPNGIWRLRFVDAGGGDIGTVSQASLTLTTAAPGQIAFQSQPNGQMILNLTEADPTANYDLQRSTDLQTWTLLQSKTTDAAGAATHTDPAPPATRSYYRYVPRP